MRLEINRRFNEEGIVVAFPSRISTWTPTARWKSGWCSRTSLAPVGDDIGHGPRGAGQRVPPAGDDPT